jgi:hypothetical protein
MVNYSQINDRQLDRTRLSAQVAEKFGWSIGGYSTAYYLANEFGIIAFALVMICAAFVQTYSIRKKNTIFDDKLLRRSLAFRVLSFALLTFSAITSDFAILLISSALSGLYVGLFWPTFYSLKSSSISRWYVKEKIIACALCLISGIIIAKIGPELVLLAATLAASRSYIQTYKISKSKNYSNLEFQRIDNNGIMALSEGCFAAIVNLWRGITLLTGNVIVFGLSGILSFTLLLVITELLGALYCHYSKFKFSEKTRISVVLLLCILGIIATIIPQQESWILGILILGIGTSTIYPMTVETVKRNLNAKGTEQRGFREDWRNRGRMIGISIILFYWCIGLPYGSLSIWLIISIAIYGKIFFIQIKCCPSSLLGEVRGFF